MANRLLDETGLRIQNPTNSRKPQPVSIARSGDGQPLFCASPRARMPREWGDDLVDELEGILSQNASPLNWSANALKNARFASTHSEALSLMRMRKELGDLAQFDEIHITTAGRHVCAFCVNVGDSAGLARIAEALGIKKLIVHADIDPLSGRFFQDVSLGTNTSRVVIENGLVTGVQ